MSLNDRQREILADLRALGGEVDVDSLAARFTVTTQTVRRDLAELCDRGPCPPHPWGRASPEFNI